MQLLEIDAETEDTFFRCLHLERPADLRVMAMRRKWREMYKPKGHRGKVLRNDDGEIIGLTNYIPIEYSPFEGRRLLSILCMWIHGYEHLIGNQQSRGYGRYMLERIEEDARENGYHGVTAWGDEHPRWFPISFYEHMGYTRVTTTGPDVLVWKSFNDRAEPPRLPSAKQTQVGESPTDGRIHLTSVSQDWCSMCCKQRIVAREACNGLNDKVKFTEEDEEYRSRIPKRSSILQVLHIDGEAIPRLSTDKLRKLLLDRYERKNR